MKHSSTIVLKAVIIFLVIIVLAVCAIVLPALIMSEMAPGADFDYGLIFLGLYIPAVPFFYALYQALKFLSYVDNNNAFSIQSVKSFKYIKSCAFLISGLFLLGMPYIFHVADRDDAPGVVAVGLIIISASFVIGTFSGLMQKLVQAALDIKSENDLTV